MKFSILTISFFVSVLLLTHITKPVTCPAPIPEQFAHVQPGNVVAGYFAAWDTYGKNKYEVNDIEPIADTLTHIVYAFAKPNPETGECELADPWADIGVNGYRKTVGGSFGKLLKLKEKFPRLKILLSIGGGTYSKDIAAIVQKGLWKTFIQSCVDLVDHYRYTYKDAVTGEQAAHTFEYPELFDGIDFDWEWLDNVVPVQEARVFGLMMTMLRQLLDERSKKIKKELMLTVALQVNASVYKALPLQEITPIIDWYHVMAYNFAGIGSSGTGFNAPICNPWSSYSIDNAVSGLMNLGISPNKLVLGVPLYGQVFDNTTAKLGSAFDKTDITGSLSYEQIKKLYVKNSACSYKWHEKSSVPYVYCPEDRVFVSFDDEQSVSRKVDYAKSKRLRGLVVWKLSGDDKEHSLVKALA